MGQVLDFKKYKKRKNTGKKIVVDYEEEFEEVHNAFNTDIFNQKFVEIFNKVTKENMTLEELKEIQKVTINVN